MPSKNDVTGDVLKTKPASQADRENFDKIFRRTIEHIPTKCCGEEAQFCHQCPAQHVENRSK